MKKCKGCGLELPESDYYFQNGRPKGRCKRCRIAEQKQWVKNHLELSHQHKKKRKTLLKDKVQALKIGPCTDCGLTFRPDCMEFDHIIDKNFGIANGVCDGLSIETIKKEIDKCELVCVRCHRLRSRKRLPTRPYKIKTREKRRLTIEEAKRKPCSVCGGIFEPCQMDFHHKDPQKKTANIAQMVAYSDERLEKELADCVLVCALCHRLEKGL